MFHVVYSKRQLLQLLRALCYPDEPITYSQLVNFMAGQIYFPLGHLHNEVL